MRDWINVEDGLPEQGRDVLVVIDRIFDGRKIEISKRLGNGKWEALYGAVLYWMPLPKMPED